MTDPLLVSVLVLLAAWAVAATLYAVLARRRSAFRLQKLAEIAAHHDRMVNLLAAAALSKGGTLYIPCREPNWTAPGVNVERTGNTWKITVSGGQH